MNKNKVFLVLVLLNFLLAGVNINGIGGYIDSPSAEGSPYQQYQIGTMAFADTEAIPGHANYFASLSTYQGLDLGFVGRTGREGVFLNLKMFRYLDDSEAPLMAAMGFENISSSGKSGDFPGVYMVTTKKFFTGSSFSFGARGLYVQKNLKMAAILGTEIFLSNELSTVFDLTPLTKDDRYNVNGGVRYYLNSNSSVYLYVLNLIRNKVDINKLSEDEKFMEQPTVITIGVSMTGFME